MHCKDIIDHFAANEAVFKMVKTKWPVIVEAVCILKMFYVTTKALQEPNFTLSDFFGYLLVVQVKLRECEKDSSRVSNLATFLQTELTLRLPMLTKNPLMLCAIFLDRRFSSELSTDERALAIKTLVDIWAKERVEKEDLIDQNNEQASESENIASVLEAYFCSKGVELMNLPTTTNQSDDSEPNFAITNIQMHMKLDQFDKQIGRQHPTKSVLQFWEEQKLSSPEIYHLSTIINAIPSTQAPVESYFSTLDFVYDEHRTRLSLPLLEQILLIKLNKEMVQGIFWKQLQTVINKKP